MRGHYHFKRLWRVRPLLDTREGLYTIMGLNDFLNGKTSLKNIPGLWYRLNGEIIKHSCRKCKKFRSRYELICFVLQVWKIIEPLGSVYKI